MSTNEEDKNYQMYSDLDDRLKNAEPRYLTEQKKRYLLASSQESLQALLDNQNDELTRVLIALKSEHDQLTLETNKIAHMIDEYDKRIKMLEFADENAKEMEEKQKKDFEFMDNGINSKKERKNEEEFTKKSLLKQKEKLNKDIFIIQKEIIHYENESQNLDKKMERAAIDENIIKEKKNKVYSKTENQKQKNRANQNENELKIQQYKKMIELKGAFLKFSDDRKEIQNQIAQKAKNDSLDKQEVEKRKTLKLLMLYNQYLRTLMNEQLKENEELEKIFEQIRDICGTKNLDEIVDFIMLRNKRYNYACQEIQNCEDKNKKLKKDIKDLKKELIELKNSLLVAEKEEGKELDVELSTNPEEDTEIIEKEKEKNKNLLQLGKKYNEIDEAYNLVIQNISSMIDSAKQNDMLKDKQEEKGGEKKEEKGEEKEEEKEEEKGEEKGENMNLELTNDELKLYKNIEISRKERKELEKYSLTEEEEILAKRAEMTDKERKEVEKMEFSELDKVIRYNLGDKNLTEEEKEIAQEIINVKLSEAEEKRVKDIALSEDEEKLALKKLQIDNIELTSDEKKQKLQNLKELKLKYIKYHRKEVKINAGYKIRKMKKNKEDMINNYELLLKEIAKRYDSLLILRNKDELINILKTKGAKVDSAQEPSRNLHKKKTRKLTKRLATNGKYKNEQYKIITENRDEEEDKSEYDLDVKILNKFLKEQKKEKENFVTGKTKIEDKK